MRKNILLLCFFWMMSHFCYAQQDSTVLSPELTKQIMDALKPDSAKVLGEYGRKACRCIDSSLKSRMVGDPEPLEIIKGCIEKETEMYQMIAKINASLFSSQKNIILNTDHNSADFKRYYTQIEDWLMDSCSALKLLVGSDDAEASEFSTSKDPDAIHQYNEGIKQFTREDYNAALPYFKKAVEIDPKFVFALDNLAICYRRLGRLDEALATYARSLAVFPRGRTPLQNIPVIYELKKDYDKAVEGYKKMLEYFPSDAESFYGMGRLLLYYKDDLKKGLDYMCKAYNSYVKMNSPYRVDAEKNIGYAYRKMKEAKQEDEFYKILKDNNINIKD